MSRLPPGLAPLGADARARRRSFYRRSSDALSTSSLESDYMDLPSARPKASFRFTAPRALRTTASEAYVLRR
jgi:hypothetical protein